MIKGTFLKRFKQAAIRNTHYQHHPIVPTPVSPSTVSWISACHFWNCRSLDKLWFALVEPSSYQYPFLEFCFKVVDTLFFFHHLVHKFILWPSIWLWNSRALLWNPKYSENVICLSILQAHFLLLCHLHMNLNIQTSWPHWLSAHLQHLASAIHLICVMFFLGQTIRYIKSFRWGQCRFAHKPNSPSTAIVLTCPIFRLLSSEQNTSISAA